MSSLRFATNYSPETGKLAPQSDTCAGTKPRGMTLCTAAKTGDLKEAKSILHNDLKSVDKSDGGGWTPLHHASKHGQDSMVKLLLSNGADIHARTDRQKDTALILAVKYKHESVVEILLEKGARVDDVADPNRALRGAADPITALHHAADRKHTAIVELLLGNGANPNLVDPSGYTPLIIAASKKNIDEMELLIGFGGTTDGLEKADDNVKRQVQSAVSGTVDLRDLRNRIHWAIGKGLVSVVKRLLDTDFELLESDSHYRRGWRPLHRASREGNVELVKLLLQHGADINCLTQGRWTPLLLASERRRCAGVIEVLVKNKADATKKTSGGHGAVDLARKNKQSEKIINMIEGLARSQMARDGKHASTEVVEDDGCTPSPISTPSSATPETNKAAPGTGTFASTVPEDEPINSVKVFSDAEPREGDRESNRQWTTWIRDFETFRKDILPNACDPNHRKVRVTIIDTGIDGEHPYLRSKGWPHDHSPHPFCDFVDSAPAEVRSHPVDQDGHGTFVAGILFQVAPDIELFVARVCATRESLEGDPQIDAKIARAIQYAIDTWETDIISISVGSDSTLPKVDKAIYEARGKNVIILAAAGNHGNRKDHVAYPARNSKVFKIFATDYYGKPTTFCPSSDREKDQDHNYAIVGCAIRSIWPLSLMHKAHALNLDVFYVRCKDKNGQDVDNTPWTVMSGTSFATPIAAALVAVIYRFYEENDYMEPTQVKTPDAIKYRFKTPDTVAAIFSRLSRTVPSEKFKLLEPKIYRRDYHRLSKVQCFWDTLCEALHS